MTEQLDVNGAPSIGIEHCNGVEGMNTPPSQQPELPLRMFISYKQKDKKAAVRIKDVLSQFGAGNIDVFVSNDEQPGQAWRELILDHLIEAHVLVFLYTDPKSQWDWCLYETGYFDGRQGPTERNRRLYVLHRREDPPSGPFLGLQTVPINTSDNPDNTDLEAFLKTVFEQATSRPVNPYWNRGNYSELVDAFSAPFRQDVGPRERKEYVRQLTFRLTTGTATQASLNAGLIPPNTMVSGNEKSFQLFGFDSERDRSWQDLEDFWQRSSSPVSGSVDGSTDPDPRILWVEHLAQKMLAAIKAEIFDDGLPLFRSPSPSFQSRAEGLFRPSLARYSLYPDAYVFDVIFVDVPPELATASRGPLTTVGILLRLAHMSRFGFIEPTARDVNRHKSAEIPKISREMWRRLHSITAESYIQDIHTEEDVLLAFEEDSELQTEIKQSLELWKNTVAPALNNAVEANDKDRLLEALEKVSKVNWQFHRACAQRYLEIVEQHYQKGTGPLNAV